MFENHIMTDGSAYLTKVLFADIHPFEASVSTCFLSRMHTTVIMNGFRRPKYPFGYYKVDYNAVT